MHIIYTETSFKTQKLKFINLKMKRFGGTSHTLNDNNGYHT